MAQIFDEDPEEIKELKRSGEWDTMSEYHQHLMWEQAGSSEITEEWTKGRLEAQERFREYEKTPEYKAYLAQIKKFRKQERQLLETIQKRRQEKAKEILGEDYDPNTIY
jgi:hypothetical protein